MNARQRAEFAAVLLGGSVAAQMLFSISASLPWQISLTIAASALAGFATVLGLMPLKKIRHLAD